MLDSAHDSSCACSHDEVVEAVRVRYQEARHIGEALTHDALRALATEVDAPPGSTIVVNPTQTARGGLVTIPVPGDGPMHMVAVDGIARARRSWSHAPRVTACPPRSPGPRSAGSSR